MGTAMECGLRIGKNRWPTIGLRTDFRGAEDGKLNAMFRLLSGVIYFSPFKEDYNTLCKEIDLKIREMIAILLGCLAAKMLSLQK
jgi:hypothetical protein